MGCSSCKEKRKLFGGSDEPNTVIENKSIGIKALIIFVNVVLFLITSVILSIIVIPFSIYTLGKVFFYDGSVDIEGLIVGINKWFKGRQEDREDRKEEEEDIREEKMELEREKMNLEREKMDLERETLGLKRMDNYIEEEDEIIYLDVDNITNEEDK